MNASYTMLGLVTEFVFIRGPSLLVLLSQHGTPSSWHQYAYACEVISVNTDLLQPFHFFLFPVKALLCLESRGSVFLSSHFPHDIQHVDQSLSPPLGEHI
jgi:hypothetical protein